MASMMTMTALLTAMIQTVILIPLVPAAVVIFSHLAPPAPQIVNALPTSAPESLGVKLVNRYRQTQKVSFFHISWIYTVHHLGR
jgi:hypothetical protein